MTELTEVIKNCVAVTKNYPHNLKVGNSKIEVVDFPGGRLDYYMQDMFLAHGFKVARLVKNKTLWMSITPMEVESHITHVNEATGNVLVGGLGMGYYITQIVAKEDVKKVTVIEYNKEIIALYLKLIEDNPTYFSNNKVEIIHGDLFETIPTLTEKYDYAYLDIWEELGSSAISPDLIKIADSGGIDAKKLGFWGMERFVRDYIDDMQYEGYLDEEVAIVLNEKVVEEFGEELAWCIKPSVKLIKELTTVEEGGYING